MTSRTRRETVTFARPFTLRGFDRMQCAGDYVVETEERLIEGLSFVAYRRVETTIFLPSYPGAAQSGRVAVIDPEELRVVLAEDVASQLT